MFRIFPVLLGITFAVGLSQFPEFAQQYTQRVGGAYDELHTAANDFRRDAASHGKTVSRAIDDYKRSEDGFFRDRGVSMQKLLRRESYLQQHYRALTGGDGYNQLLVFTMERDMDIARDAFGIYKPALPLTFTGMAHAALGFLLGYGVLRFPILRRRRRVMA